MFCKFCGAKIKNQQAKFCPECGEQIKSSLTDSAENNTPTETTLANDHAVIDTQATSDLSPEPEVSVTDQPPIPQNSPEPMPDTESLPASAAPGPQTVLPEQSAPPTAPLSPIKKTKQAPKRRFMPVIIALWAVVLCVGGMFGFLFYQTRPQQFYASIRDASQSQDYGKLHALVCGEEGEPIPIDTLKALGKKMADSEEWSAMERHIADRLAGLDGNPNYSAIGVTSEPLFSFLPFRKYQLALSPVSFTVTANVDDYAVIVRGENARSEKGEEAEWSVSTLPGIYPITGKIVSDYCSAEAEAESELYLADSDKNEVYLRFPVFEIAVACNQQPVQIFIDDVATDLQPINKTLTIPYAMEGMRVRGVYTQNNQESSSEFIVSSPDASYQLIFEDLSSLGRHSLFISGESGGSETESAAIHALLSMKRDDLDQMVARDLIAYYSSYISCINQQNVRAVQRIHEDYLSTLEERVERNKDYRYNFKRMVIDKDSIAYRFVDDTIQVDLIAKFEYEYQRKSDSSSWTDGASIQECVMRFDEDVNAWLVLSTVIDNEISIGDDTLEMER